MNNELNIFWTNGVSKFQFINTMIMLSFILMIFQIFLASYLAPLSQYKAREIISKVFTDIDFNNEKFPFMTFKTFDYKNTQARIMRASFTGELGYEIYISPKHALELWEQLFNYGK